eukprot:1151862-Pelagomonas_calceolata.AAC.3
MMKTSEAKRRWKLPRQVSDHEQAGTDPIRKHKIMCRDRDRSFTSKGVCGLVGASGIVADSSRSQHGWTWRAT